MSNPTRGTTSCASATAASRRVDYQAAQQTVAIAFRPDSGPPAGFGLRRAPVLLAA
jgi:hypothetical protein